MGGRRGEISLVYELIISLLLIAMFSLASISFIERNANGDAYFSRFYANDLATSAQVVNAGAGDVVLRYDNIKPGLDLEFRNKNGRVEVGKYAMEFTQTAAAFYGKADNAQLQDYEHPTYLVLKKVGGVFTMQSVEQDLLACPQIQPDVPLQQLTINLQAPGAEESFKNVLSELPVKYGANGDIHLRVERIAGSENKVTFAPKSPHNEAFACQFMQQLERATVTRFTPAFGEGHSDGLNVQITIALSPDSVLTDDQVGRILALALVGYYR